MPLKFFKTLERDTIASGGTWEDAWMPDVGFTLKRIFLLRKDGSPFTASTFYFKVKERVFTLPSAPATVFRAAASDNPTLEIPVAAGEIIAWSFKNNEGTSISVILSFECWE